MELGFSRISITVAMTFNRTFPTSRGGNFHKNSHKMTKIRKLKIFFG